MRGSLDAQIKDRALSTSRPSLFTEHFYESFAFFLGLAQSMTFRIFCVRGGGRKLSLITVFFFHDHKHLDTQESGSISF